MSENISALEKSLSYRLLQRTTRKISLTDEGKAVYKLSQNIHELLSDIDSLELIEKAAGKVSISINTDIAQDWLIPLLVEFNQKFPDIFVKISIDEFASDLIDENIDLALRVSSPENQSSFVGRVMGKETTCFYASPGYLQQYGSVSLKNIHTHKWVLLTQMTHKKGIDLFRGKNQHVIKPKICNETDSPKILIQMLEKDFGLGILLPSTAKNSVKHGKLVKVLPQYHNVTLQISLVYPSRNLPLRTRLLVDHLIVSGW